MPIFTNNNTKSSGNDNGILTLLCSKVRFIIMRILNVNIMYKYVFNKYLLHVNLPFSKELIAIV